MLLVLTAWVVPVALVAVGLQANARSTAPRQERVRQIIDSDAGTFRWETSGRSEWGRRLAAEPALPTDLAIRADSTDPAQPDDPAQPVPGPQITVLADTTGAGGRTLDLAIVSARSAPTITIDLPAEAGLRQVFLEGRELPVSEDGARIHLAGVPGEGAMLQVVLDRAGPVDVTVSDHSPSLAGLSQADPPPGWVVTNPQVQVSRTVTL